MLPPWGSFAPSPEVARRYRDQGWWRDTTFSDDLRKSAAERPDDTALLTWRHCEGRLVPLSFREFDERADAVAGALLELGVRRGEVVAHLLPTWWQAAVLMIACLRVGAVVAPVQTVFGRLMTERTLAAVGAVACVVPDEWDGIPYARQLLEQESRLPSLRHRIVIGDAAATNAVSLDDAFQGRAVSGRPQDLEPLAADDPFAIIMTSGTTGEAQLVVHSANTLYGIPRPALQDSGQIRAITTGLAFVAAFRRVVHTTAPSVGVTFLSDSQDPGGWLDLIEQNGVYDLWTTPRMLRELTEEQQRRARDVSSLQVISSFGGPLPQVTLSAVLKELCPVVRNVWGMTECGSVLSTGPDDPPEHAARSLGQVISGREIRLRPAGRTAHGDVFRLHVRGPATCLATVGRDSGQVRWSPNEDDGWLDSGDLVTCDEAGELRFIGRAAERIGDTWQMPVADIEAALLTHPAIDDAALVPWRHADGRETACAAVISSSRPGLGEVRDHLERLGFHESCLPTRIEHVADFPRTELGKVRRKVLLDRLTGHVREPAG
jgi:cyclohexanecarboxylate-CoA ligase